MKKIKTIFICFIILGFFLCQAYCDENEQLDLAYRIVEKTRVTKMFIDLSETFMETYFERYDTHSENDPAGSDPLKKIFIDEVNSGEDELKWMLAEIYAAQFSQAELEAILFFFNSQAGNAWLDKKLLIQTESEQIGLEWGRLLTQRVLKKFETHYGRED